VGAAEIDGEDLHALSPFCVEITPLHKALAQHKSSVKTACSRRVLGDLSAESFIITDATLAIKGYHEMFD